MLDTSSLESSQNISNELNSTHKTTGNIGDKSFGYDMPLTIHDRLYAEATLEHEPKVEKDVLITTLSTDTIRWIKRRRVMEAKHRVAITHFREGQLREIFDGLDFDSTGIIDLAELKNAVKYAEEELKGKRGPSFKDVEKMFAAMDEDGNGEVDYHEFMISMTGSSKSLIDQASEQDVEKLRAKFKEYAIKKKREYFVKAIDAKPTVTSVSGAGNSPERHGAVSAVPGVGAPNPSTAESLTSSTTAPIISDGDKCKYFMSLFRIGGSGSTPTRDTTAILKPTNNEDSQFLHGIPHPGEHFEDGHHSHGRHGHHSRGDDGSEPSSRGSNRSRSDDDSRAHSPLMHGNRHGHSHSHSPHSGSHKRHHRPAAHVAPNSPARIERILEPFAKIDKASRDQNLNPTKKEFFYYQLEERIKNERRQAYADIQMDPEARDTENRVLHEKEYIIQQRRPGPYDCRLKFRRPQVLSPLPDAARLSTCHLTNIKKKATVDAKTVRSSRNLNIPDSPFRFPTSSEYFPDGDPTIRANYGFNTTSVPSETGSARGSDSGSVNSTNRVKVGRTFTALSETMWEKSDPKPWTTGDFPGEHLNDIPSTIRQGRPRSPLVAAMKKEREHLLTDDVLVQCEKEANEYKQYILDFGSLDDDKRCVGIVDSMSSRNYKKSTGVPRSRSPNRKGAFSTRLNNRNHSVEEMVVPEQVIQKGIERLRREYKQSHSTPVLNQDEYKTRTHSSYSAYSEF